MGDNAARLGATLIMWAAVVVIFLDGTTNNTVAHEMLVAFAAIATLGMWIAPYLGRNKDEKAKRQAAAVDEHELRLRILMDMMDDEEKARIRSKLMNGFSDGELPVDEFLEDSSVTSLRSEM